MRRRAFIKGGMVSALKGFVLVSDTLCQQTRTPCMTTARVRFKVRRDDFQVRYVFPLRQ